MNLTLPVMQDMVRQNHRPWVNEDYPHLGPSCVDCGEDFPCMTIQFSDEIDALNKQVAAMHAGHSISDGDSCNVVIRMLQQNNSIFTTAFTHVRKLCEGRGNETAIAVAMYIDRVRS